jgi:hypothetical protein
MAFAATTANPRIASKTLEYPASALFATVYKTAVLIVIAVKGFCNFMSFNIPHIMGFYIVIPAKGEN